MKTQTFEEYLEEQCFTGENNMVLDDDMPDFLDNWIGNLDVQEVIDYAEEYGKKMYLAGKEVEDLLKTDH